MAELTMRADPTMWSLVPQPAEADAWLHARTAASTAERRERTLDGAILALRTSVETDAAVVLLLDDPATDVIATLTVFAYDDVPPAVDAGEARQIARTTTSSPWDVEMLEVRLGRLSGWRASLLEEDPGDEAAGQGTTAEPAARVIGLISTAYVLDLDSRMLLALLPPLNPDAAFFAQVQAEAVLSTFERAST